MSFTPSLDYLRTYRKMPWIKRGMKIIVNGKEGHVAGGYAGNVAVKFPDRNFTENCHPWWKTVYYDNQGNIVADYRESEQA